MMPFNAMRLRAAGGGVVDNVVSLLHLDGTNGSTTITDERGKTWAVNDNAQISTVESKFGGASCRFDGTDDAIYVPGSAHADFIFGTSDFTVEFWVYRDASQANAIHVLFDMRPVGTQGAYPTIYVDNGTLKYFTSNGDRINGGAISTGAFHHIAVARASGSTKLFLNGTQVGITYTDSNNYTCGTARPCLGASGVGLTTLELTGYIDEVRITKGLAQYTANFTPPSSPFT